MRNQVLEFNSGSIDENGIFGEWFEFLSQLCEIRGQIERIENLMVNWGLNRSNKKPEIKIKKARTFKVAVEILTGIRLHKIKSSKLIWGAIEPIKHWGTKLYFSNTNLACPCTVPTPGQCRNSPASPWSSAKMQRPQCRNDPTTFPQASALCPLQKCRGNNTHTHKMHAKISQ